MITIVLIIAVVIIAVLTAYGWWKTNERIDYEVQCRIADYKMLCETIEKVDKLSMQTIPMIMHKITEFDNEFTEIKGKIEDLTNDIKRSNGLLNIANDRIKILTRRLENIDARYKYLHDRLLTHCHAYKVENNTLYIQNPLWIDNTKEHKAIEKNEEG